MKIHPYLALSFIATACLCSFNDDKDAEEQLKQEQIRKQEEAKQREIELEQKRLEQELQRIRELHAVLRKSCSPGAKFTAEEIDLLIHIVLNPEEKDEQGNYLYNSPQGPIAAAANAAAILGQEASNDPKIYDHVFNLLAKDVTKLHKHLLDIILERLVIVHPKGLNGKLNALIKGINLKEQKSQNTAETIFSYKRNLINAKTAESDLKLVVPMFCDEIVEDKLRLELHYYILQIFRDGKLNDATKKKIGNEIFTKLAGNEKMLDSPYTCKVLGASGSEKALEYYMSKMSDKNKWKDYKAFFEEWKDPGILSELVALRDSCTPEEKKQAGTMNSILFGIAFTERDMPTDEARKLIRIVYPDYDTDTTPLNRLDMKRREEGKLVGDEQKEWQRLSAALTHRYNLVKHFGTFSEEYQWVKDIVAQDKAFISKIPNTDDAPWCYRLKDYEKLLYDVSDKIKRNMAQKVKREAYRAKRK